MGDRGPLQKDQRVRDRDTAKRDALKVDDEVRGWPLPEGVLGKERVFVPDLEPDDPDFDETDGHWEVRDVEWHPQVVKWWEAFRRSPMAQRVLVDVQWESLLASMLAYQDVWTQGSKGRHSRLAEFRAVFTSFFITPGDLRRNGLEIELPKNDEAEAKPEDGKPAVASVTSLEARKQRILASVPDAAAEKAAAKKAAPKKKATPRKRSTAERAAIARKTTPAKKAVAKKTAAKRPSKPTG